MRTRTVTDTLTHRSPAPGLPRFLAAAIALLLALPACLRADDYDRWYAVEMAGGRAGWMHTAQKTDGDTITTTSETKLSFARSQASISVSMEGRFVETAAGKPISMHTEMKFGTVPTIMDCTFAD